MLYDVVRTCCAQRPYVRSFAVLRMTKQSAWLRRNTLCASGVGQWTVSVICIGRQRHPSGERTRLALSFIQVLQGH